MTTRKPAKRRSTVDVSVRVRPDESSAERAFGKSSDPTQMYLSGCGCPQWPCLNFRKLCQCRAARIDPWCWMAFPFDPPSIPIHRGVDRFGATATSRLFGPIQPRLPGCTAAPGSPRLWSLAATRTGASRLSDPAWSASSARASPARCWPAGRRGRARREARSPQPPTRPTNHRPRPHPPRFRRPLPLLPGGGPRGLLERSSVLRPSAVLSPCPSRLTGRSV